MKGKETESRKREKEVKERMGTLPFQQVEGSSLVLPLSLKSKGKRVAALNGRAWSVKATET